MLGEGSTELMEGGPGMGRWVVRGQNGEKGWVGKEAKGASGYQGMRAGRYHGAEGRMGGTRSKGGSRGRCRRFGPRRVVEKRLG